MLCSQRDSVLTIIKKKDTLLRLSIRMAQLGVIHSLQLTKCLWKRNFQWHYERKLVIFLFLHRRRWQWTKTYIIIKTANNVLSRQTSYVKRKTRESSGKSQRKKKTKQHLCFTLETLWSSAVMEIKNVFSSVCVYVYMQSYLLCSERHNNTCKEIAQTYPLARQKLNFTYVQQQGYKVKVKEKKIQ